MTEHKVYSLQGESHVFSSVELTLTSNDTSQPSLLPDLTPLLDVIFIVMVFLMLSANVAPLALPIDLLTLGAEQAEVVDEPITLAVNIFKDSGSWALDGKEFET